MKNINTIGRYWKKKHGEKVYKIPISISGFTCPNIDGTVANATSASSATNAVTASFVASTLQFGTTSTLGTAVNGALAVSSSGDLYFGSASAWYKVTLG